MRLHLTTLLFLFLRAESCLDGCFCNNDVSSFMIECTLAGNHSNLPDVLALNTTFYSIILQGSIDNPWIIDRIGPGAFAGWKTQRLTLQLLQIGTIDPDAFRDIDDGLLYLIIGLTNIDDIPAGLFRYMTRLFALVIAETNVWNVRKDWFIGIESIKALALYDNKVSTIEQDAFASLRNLQILYLYQNNITDVSDAGLSSLTQLNDLQLNNNPLKFIPTSIFNSTLLTNLVLDDTQVTTLPCDAFVVQPFEFTTISLQRCGITDIGALLGGGSEFNYCWPKSISKIDLSNNQVARWPNASVFNLSSVPDKILSLNNNPLSCDCDMASGRRDFGRIVVNSIQRKCSSPSTVAGKSVLCFDPRLVPCSTLTNSCDYDPTEFPTCSAIDSSIQFPFNSSRNNISSISPSSGPAYGGLKVSFYGSGFNSLAIKSVQFGDQLTSQADNGYSTVDKINITTPKSYILDQPLPISFEFCDGFVLNTGYNFTFRKPTPVITQIYPTAYLTSGGTEMNLTVLYLDWIQTQPELQLSITSIIGRKSTINEVCSMDSSSSSVVCIVPAFNWLSPFNISVSFKFDEFIITSSIQIEFYSPPNFNRLFITFDPSTSDNITVKGQNLLRGCQQSDYIVSIGVAPCQIVSLSDTELICEPPSSSPIEADNSNCLENQRTLTIKIGYATFQPACIEYLETITTTSAVHSSVSTVTPSTTHTAAATAIAAANGTTTTATSANTVKLPNFSSNKVNNKKSRRCWKKNRSLRRRLICLRRLRRFRKMKG